MIEGRIEYYLAEIIQKKSEDLPKTKKGPYPGHTGYWNSTLKCLTEIENKKNLLTVIINNIIENI